MNNDTQYDRLLKRQRDRLMQQILGIKLMERTTERDRQRD